MPSADFFKKFISEENIIQIKQYFERVISNREYDNASEIKRMLSAFLVDFKANEKEYSKQFNFFNRVIIICKFLTLNRIPAGDLNGFFSQHWVEQYEIPDFADGQSDTFYNLFEVVMLTLPYDERDQYKSAIIKGLKENNQILLVENKKNKKITVSSLLLDFDATRQGDKLDTLSTLKYIDLIALKDKLTEVEKGKIQHLLNFYKLLSTSSLTEEGAEEVFIFQDEDDDTLKVFNKGVVEELKDKNIQKIVNDIFETYGDKEQKQLATEFSNKLLHSYKLRKISEHDIYRKLNSWPAINTKEFEKSFHLAINKREQENIIISLFKLAREGFLDEIFERDVKIKDIFKVHLTKKFSEKLAKHFEQNLKAPVYLSYFLQHVLKDILRLDENESAVLAIKLVNELKRAGDKQYLPIAYGDLKQGVFKWKAIIEKDDTLELEGKND